MYHPNPQPITPPIPIPITPPTGPKHTKSDTSISAPSPPPATPMPVSPRRRPAATRPTKPPSVTPNRVRSTRTRTKLDFGSSLGSSQGDILKADIRVHSSSDLRIGLRHREAYQHDRMAA